MRSFAVLINLKRLSCSNAYTHYTPSVKKVDFVDFKVKSLWFEFGHHGNGNGEVFIFVQRLGESGKLIFSPSKWTYIARTRKQSELVNGGFDESFMPSSKNCSHDQIGSGYNSSVNQPESLAHRRFTRQRKLRHLSDDDTGIRFHHHPQSTPSSPDSFRIQRSMVGCSERWSSWAVPQPLPLPEFTSSRKAESPASYSCPGHYPSPQETPGRKSPCPVISNSAKIVGNCQKKVPRDVNCDGVDVNCGQTLPPSRSSPIIGSSAGAVSPRGSSRDDFFRSYADTGSAEYSNKYGRRLLQELNVERGGERLTLKVSSRSTPTSVLSSPVVSPRRSNTGDFYSSFPDLQQFKDFPSSGAAKISMPRISTSPPDRSPPHSPTAKSPLHSTRSPNGTAFALHHKPFQEISMDRPENNGHVNAYPLPLPPGPIVSSQPTMSHHVKDNPYASMMKGKWHKGKLIGRGTFGSVYLATNRETGALCAMKEVDVIADDPKSAECIKQLEQEIKVLHKLKHPNIVQYYGSERIDDHFYIYLEYVYPGSINKYIREHFGAMTESIVRNFTRHILSGLTYLHSKKTIHRDIKGANLLVNAFGVVKLADFGMAKHLAGQYDLSLKGSPHWMAPEVIKASMQGRNSDLACAVDIWSLGCTIIEMLNGKPPWSEFEGPSAMFKILNINPPIPETISSEAKNFLRCCFQRNPAERPSANTLLEHPFLCQPHDENVSFSTQLSSTTNLHEKLASPNELARVKVDQTSSSPGIKITNRQCRSPSSSSSANAALTAVNNHLFGISRNHGREVEQL